VTRWQRDELVEARADAILAGARTAEAYTGHFEDQLRAARFRAWGWGGLRASLRVLLRALSGPTWPVGAATWPVP
jgi:hypothetical protein